MNELICARQYSVGNKRVCFKVVPHVVGETHQFHRFWWKLVELHFIAYAVGIQVTVQTVEPIVFL